MELYFWSEFITVNALSSYEISREQAILLGVLKFFGARQLKQLYMSGKLLYRGIKHASSPDEGRFAENVVKTMQRDCICTMLNSDKLVTKKNLEGMFEYYNK